MIYACEGRFKFKFSSSKINIAESSSIKTEDVAGRGSGRGMEMLSAVTDDSDMAGISFSLFSPPLLPLFLPLSLTLWECDAAHKFQFSIKMLVKNAGNLRFFITYTQSMCV